MTKTVRVRIAVAVDPTGAWSSAGWSEQDESVLHSYCSETLAPGERHYWVEATLEVPEVTTHEGELTND